MDIANDTMFEDKVLHNIMNDDDLDIIPDIKESSNTSALEKFINNCYSELKNKENGKKVKHQNGHVANSTMI